MAPVPERMSRVDTAWLRMDTDANLMMIIGFWLLAPRIAREDVAARVQATMLKYRRFQQRVEEDAMGASWVDDEDFDIDAHVVAEALPRRRGQSPEQALKQRVAELASVPLDRSRPLWQMHVVEDLDGQHSAIIIRIHHCIADGIALISVTMTMMDGGKPPPVRRRRPPPENEAEWLSEVVIKPFTDLTVKAIGITGEGMARSMEMLANPAQPLFGSVEMARTAYQVVSDAAAIALMADDSPTRLKGKPVPGKRVAWCDPLPLDEVKAVSKALGGSVNDVMLSCVAGAIGAYLRGKGDDVTGKEIRAMVPVNLRPMEEAWQLGNRFGLVPLVLPIGIADPLSRLHAVRARMAELKGSYQPLLALGVLALAGLLVKPVQAALLNMFARKATAVMTNVPGPREPLRFCGRALKQVMFWVPQSGDIGMGVSILSYDGGVQFGLITDRRMCPDPQAIADRFRPEFEKLLWLALMAPWPADELQAA